MTTKLHLLGRPYAEVDGRIVDLPAKAAALLGYLALSTDPQPRDRILGLLWGESSEEAARKNLRNTLWGIRKDLGPNTVVTTGDRLALHEDLEVDARVLRADAADDPDAVLALYGGPFLDGLALADAPDFELWLLSARERLAGAFFSAMVEGVAALNRRGAWRDAAALARAALAHDPLHEGLVRELMQALAGLGERGEALRQYEALKAGLERELGVPPAAETFALRGTIASNAALPALAGVRARARREMVATTHTQPETPFIGRSRERATLDEELARATTGQARVAVLTGELGIGKSRLWREWQAGVRIECGVPDAPPLEARCVEAASSLPFTPLVELFANHPCTQELFHRPPAAPSALPGAWLAEVSRLLPQVRADTPGLPAPTSLPPEEERRRVFEAFVQVLLALDAHPLVVFVDDVHWADRATLDWLPYLVHRMRAQPVLLVLAYRPEEAPAVLVHQVAAWGREGVLRRIHLGRLAPEETAALISGLDVDAGVAHQLQAQSAGNPYFLLELSRSVDAVSQGRVPPALADLVAARIDRLSDDAQAVLQAAGILEPEFDLPLLTHSTGLVEDAVLDALDELLAARVLAERGGRFVFYHPLLSRVVRQRLNAARRQVLHRRAAQALEVAHADAVSPLAGLIADHYVEAGDHPRAAAYLDVAADHAASLAANAEMVAFRRRAWQLQRTPSRGLALGTALSRSGALGEAREAYAQALAEADRLGDVKTAARACLSMAVTYLPGGWIDELRQWTELGLRYLDAEADPWAHAYAHFLLGAGRLRAGGSELEKAEADLAEAARLAEDHHVQEVAMVARFELGNAHAERGDLAGAIRMYEQAIDLARAAGDPNREVLALNNLAYHTMLAGDRIGARAYIAQAIALADQYGLDMSREYLLSTRGEIELADGRWTEAEAYFNASQAAAEDHSNLPHIAKCRANLGLVAAGRGDLDSALILLEEAAERAAPLVARYMQAQIDLWLTEIYIQRGEHAAAVATLERAEERLVNSHYRGLIDRGRELRATLGQE